MKAGIALESVGAIAEQQHGLFTTQQAESVSVPRLALSRLNQDGLLRRVTRGVYRVHGTPRDIHEDLRADWLALDPIRTAPERFADHTRIIAASHRSAAAVHGIGDLPADVHHFVSDSRKQSERARVTVPRKPMDPASIEIVDGLPVTTVERTLADLAKTEADISHVADAAADADARGALRHDVLARELDPLARMLGARSGGQAVDHLLAYRGLDTGSLVSAVLANSQFQASLDALRSSLTSDAIRTIQAAIGESLAASEAIRPALEAMQAVAALQANSEAIEAVIAHLHPDLNEYLAASRRAFDAITRPTLTAMAQDPFGPSYAALRAAAHVTSEPPSANPDNHA